jgi:hypothetical protein
MSLCSACIRIGFFTVKSMYSFLVSIGIKVSQLVWRVKIPSKIKIFLCFFQRRVIPTKDNLAERNQNGDRS